jgi:hypothetical protein
MKLPPMALTAPTLCPRCDAPAIMTDHCVQCALQLRQCGACQGTAGPFDRFCGFCGHEMILGDRRSPVWRLWLLAALVPLAAGILLGALGFGVPVTHAVGRSVGLIPKATPVPGSINSLRSHTLSFSYSVPRDWTAVDYTLSSDPARVLPFVIASRLSADGTKAADAKGELADLKPQGTVVDLGRPATDLSLVAPDDPKAVLTSRVAPLVIAPPAGSKIEVVRQVKSITVGGRPGAEVVLRITTGTIVVYTERAFVYAPLAGAAAMFRMEAVAPAADWEGGDGDRVEAILQSIKFG